MIASLVGKTSLHSGVAHSQSPTTATTVTTPRTLNKALPPDHTVNAGELLHRPLAWSLAPLAIVQTEARPPHREAETYSKGVQTTPNDAQTTSDSSDSDKFRTKERPPRRRLSLREPHVVSDRNKSDNVDKAHTYSPKPYQEQESGLQRQDGSHASVPRLVPNHELEALALSNDFQNFLELSSKVAERAIEEQYDVLKDYRLGEFNDSDENEDAANSRQRRGIRVKEIAQLYDGVWSKQRMISDIAWSPKASAQDFTESLFSLTDTVFRAATRIIHEKYIRTPRPRRHYTSLEHEHAHPARVHLSCNDRNNDGEILTIPSQSHRRWILCRTGPSLGHSITLAVGRPEVSNY